METWRPPADPGKPSCPYRPGFTKILQRHSPPAPDGHKLYMFDRKDPNRKCPFAITKRLESMMQSELVWQHPNKQGPELVAESGLSSYSEARMTVTKVISIGNARGAQIVRCVISPQSDAVPFTATAKIYDPMYYCFSNSMVWRPVDVCCRSQVDYSREAAAYEHLEATGQAGHFAPAYYGSWAFNITETPSPDADGVDIRPARSRQVRLILMEDLETGVTLKDLYALNECGPDRPSVTDAFHYSEEYRINIMAKVLEGECRLIHTGLDQSDQAPRNIMVVPDPRLMQAGQELLTEPRVVLIDYNISLVFPRTTMGKHSAQNQPLPPNPLERHWHISWGEFLGWIPPWWLERRLWHAWLIERYNGDRKQHYAPLSEEFVEEMNEDSRHDPDDEAAGQQKEI